LKKIFIFHTNLTASGAIANLLKIQYGVDAICDDNFENAIKQLKAWEFPLIISIDKMKDEEDRVIDCAAHFLNVINDNSYESKVLVLGELDVSFGDYSTIKFDADCDDICREVVKILNITKEEIDYVKQPDYLAIPIQNFYQLNNPCADIYIRIKKQGGDQFVKRINADEEMDKGIVKKYELMNLTELYVKKENFSHLMNQILNQSIKRIVEAHRAGENILEVSSDSYEISQNFIEQLGVTPGTIKMAKTSIKSMMKTVSANSKLSAILKEILQNESSYSYKRSYLVSLFAYQIMPELGWGRGEQLHQNLEKMTFVSFFHDAYLRDDKLVRIMSNDELEASDLTGAEKTLVLEHANRASTLVQGIPQCPAGIDVIIRQHHGAANGIGFPTSLTSSISPMAVVFIVLEDFSDHILRSVYNKEKVSIIETLTKLEEKYKLPSFKKVLELLKNLLVK